MRDLADTGIPLEDWNKLLGAPPLFLDQLTGRHLISEWAGKFPAGGYIAIDAAGCLWEYQVGSGTWTIVPR